MAGSGGSGFAAGCCSCCLGAVGGAFGDWFFGGGGLYTLAAAFPALGVGRELLFDCGAFFAFQLVLGWAGRLLVVVPAPDGCCTTGSTLAGRSLLVEAR